MINERRQISSWRLQDAKARFSDFLNAALEKGPQVVTRRGVEPAVFVPIEEWRCMQRTRRTGIKEWLLSGRRFTSLIRPRRQLKLRPPVEFK
jgi:antitoxin Phd